METKDIPTEKVSEWQPITNKHDLALLGKLIEEAGELSAAAARCIIQGLDECEPKTGKPNRQWLEEELADVSALTAFAIHRLSLDKKAIGDRQARKIAFKTPWFVSLSEKP